MITITHDVSTVPPSLDEDEPVIDPAVVRRWAAQNNIEVGKRGRLPASLIARYVKSTRS
jgi:hypothetical protein